MVSIYIIPGCLLNLIYLCKRTISGNITHDILLINLVGSEQIVSLKQLMSDVSQRLVGSQSLCLEDREVPSVQCLHMCVCVHVCAAYD